MICKNIVGVTTNTYLYNKIVLRKTNMNNYYKSSLTSACTYYLLKEDSRSVHNDKITGMQMNEYSYFEVGNCKEDKKDDATFEILCRFFR